MCNDYEQRVAWADYCAMLRALELGLPRHQSDLDLPQADDVRIGDTAPVMRATENGIELAAMTFGFPSAGKGGPVFNFRSEGRHFGDSWRWVIPASAFFECTGKKYPKAKHRFALSGGTSIMAIAGLWREGLGNQPPAFTMLTTAPGADVAPYHNRQIVVLRPDDWAHWLYMTKSEDALLRPLGPGSLAVETVRQSSDVQMLL